ncbi:MAG: OmpH family outer membrane protein [Alphaproteobacteria bacterium]|nr:OmpH family outer membrane protein [Alphaproteobacteria bacterium]
MLRLLAPFVVALLLSGGAAAQVQPLPPAVIAVLDTGLIHRDSAAGRDINTQMEKYRNDVQVEITKDEDGLRAQEQELLRQRTLLTADAFAEKEKQFRERVAAVQRKVQDLSRAMDRVHDRARRELTQVLLEVVAAMSIDRQFNLVLDRNQIPFAHTSLDITNQVIQEINKRKAKIAVADPRKDKG